MKFSKSNQLNSASRTSNRVKRADRITMRQLESEEYRMSQQYQDGKMKVKEVTDEVPEVTPVQDVLEGPVHSDIPDSPVTGN